MYRRRYRTSSTENKWSKYFDIRPNRCRTRTVQSYSQVAPMCPHVIHASFGPPESTNSNEISIGSAIFAQLMPECRRACPGMSFALKIASSHGGSGLHLIHDSSPIQAHNPNGISIGSAVFAHFTAECPYTLQWATLPPLKIVPSHGTRGSLGPPKSSTQTASRSVQPFL